MPGTTPYQYLAPIVMKSEAKTCTSAWCLVYALPPEALSAGPLTIRRGEGAIGFAKYYVKLMMTF